MTKKQNREENKLMNIYIIYIVYIYTSSTEFIHSQTVGFNSFFIDMHSIHIHDNIACWHVHVYTLPNALLIIQSDKLRIESIRQKKKKEKKENVPYLFTVLLKLK